MTASKVVLWRHGQTGHNATNRWQGHLDIDLDDVGRGQAERAAEQLAALTPSAVVSSDLVRAVDTAAVLGRLTGLTVAADPDLREVNAGRWQGLTSDEIDARWPGELRAWRDGDDVPIGGAERRSEAAARAAAAVDRHAAKVDDGGLLVVCSHGGTLRGATLQLIGLPISAWSAFVGLANSHWSVLVRRPSGWVIAEYNVGPRGAHVGAEA